MLDGDYVRSLRLRRGWEVSDLIHKLTQEHGITLSRSHLYALENGNRRYTRPPVVLALAALFGVAVEALYTSPTALRRWPR